MKFGSGGRGAGSALDYYRGRSCVGEYTGGERGQEGHVHPFCGSTPNSINLIKRMKRRARACE